MTSCSDGSLSLASCLLSPTAALLHTFDIDAALEPATKASLLRRWTRDVADKDVREKQHTW